MDGKIVVQNAYQNLTQPRLANAPGISNARPLNPTTQDFNKIISGNQATADESEPMFGSHIRETISVVKGWARR